MKISIIIRTFNEAKHISNCLAAVRNQTFICDLEIIIVDSESTDNTVELAEVFDVKVHTIKKIDFTFGRAINIGCDKSNGDILIFLSAHCIPLNSSWLAALVKPILDCEAVYCYSRQIGSSSVSNFGEMQLFKKVYPANVKNHRQFPYCNNASSALTRDVWERHRFIEELTGLEDLDLAMRLADVGLKTCYAAESVVTHIHQESYSQVINRFKREAEALATIDSSRTLGFFGVCKVFLKYFIGDFLSFLSAPKLGKLSFASYRFAQAIGLYKGFAKSRAIIKKKNREYYFGS